MTEPVCAATLTVVDPLHQSGGLDDWIGIHV